MDDSKLMFDTKVQYIKYKVLREVAKHAFQGDLLENINEIPKVISPGPESQMRCCIYKERAIVSERIQRAIEGVKINQNVISVINIACDECPMEGYEVTEDCRGCLAHRCKRACPKDAISFDEKQKARIDKSKCVNCGLCAQACPYTAIRNRTRPCMAACKVKAISTSIDGSAMINDEKCITCGSCVYQCPFGAITDRSSIVQIINELKNPENHHSRSLYQSTETGCCFWFIYRYRLPKETSPRTAPRCGTYRFPEWREIPKRHCCTRQTALSPPRSWNRSARVPHPEGHPLPGWLRDWFPSGVRISKSPARLLI